MNDSEKLRIVGVNHVAETSQATITAAFADHDPDVVAIELDEQRLQSLRQGDHGAPSTALIPHIGLTGYVFARIAYHAQHLIGEKTGIIPGAEMLHAADLAAQHGKPLHLIDQPFQTTLRNLTDALTVTEKLRMVADVLTAPFTDPPVAFDPSTIPDTDVIAAITEHISERYPRLYQAVIADRDKHMAKEIQRLLDNDNTVLAVVGAAHKPGIQRGLT